MGSLNIMERVSQKIIFLCFPDGQKALVQSFKIIYIIRTRKGQMSLSFFAIKNQYYKNGIWWFTKILNRAVGEQRYQGLRVTRRILQNKMYYIRQQMLYRLFIESPDLSCMIGVYPKTDSSHGYGSNISYEMYRDFQENTLNSDGSFAMWILFIAVVYTGHVLYTYMIPWYWNKTATCKNGEEQRVRMRDAISATILEECIGIQYAEVGWGSHDFHNIRHKLAEGHAHPDDVRAMHVSALNRKNRYIEHYVLEVGGQRQKSMMYHH